MFNVRFPTSLYEARKFQLIVSQQISLEDEIEYINYVTALDISYKNKRAYGAAIFYDCKKTKIRICLRPSFHARGTNISKISRAIRKSA